MVAVYIIKVKFWQQNEWNVGFPVGVKRVVATEGNCERLQPKALIVGEAKQTVYNLRAQPFKTISLTK
jgi:hypothetical protein